MPALACLDRKVLLCKSNECLAQTEVRRTGHFIVPESVVEVTFHACAHLPSFNLVTFGFHPKAGSKGCETGVGISVHVITVGRKFLVVRNIGEEVFGKTYHLAGIEGIEVTDEAVHLDAGLAFLGECRKAESCKHYCGKYLFHNQFVKRKGKVW